MLFLFASFGPCTCNILQLSALARTTYYSFRPLHVQHITALEGYGNQDVTGYAHHELGSSLVSYLCYAVDNATNIMEIASAEVFLHPSQDNISGFYPSVKLFSHCYGPKLVLWALIYII